MSCSLARAAAPPVTALSTPPRKKPRLFSPEPARAAPAQQTAIRSGEGTNVQPDRFGCWCRTAGCLIPLFTCVLNLETDQVRGGAPPENKSRPPAAAICVPPPPSRECLTPFLLLLPRPESRCAHARRRSRFVGGGGDAPSGKSSSGDAGGLIRRRLPGLSTSRPLGRGSLVTTLLGIRTA